MSRKRPPRRRPSREPVRITIDSIAAGGEGVGRLPDGRAIFVHRTAPGDTVDAEITYERPRWARGRLLNVVTPSTDRRPAPCPHYADCGGCTIEHLEYAAQLRIKSRIVADALSRIGGLDIDLPDVVPSPLEHRYRNRVSFALLRAAHGQVHAGFHALYEPGRIVPIDGACLLPEAPIGEVWDRLRASWGPDANRLPSGERLRLTLRATSAGAVSLVVQGGYSTGQPQELLELVDGLESIWYAPESGATALVAGSPGLPETWGDERFELGGTAFLQINRAAAALLEDHVLAVAGDVARLRIVDAYCGIGLHARRLARAGASVVGIELDPEAGRIAIAAGLPESGFLEGRVEDRLPEALPADLLILNPPRSGVDPAVVEAIAGEPPARIIYVSCDPATLARDLKRLGDTFELAGVRCFDLFPQTDHVETVAVLRRR